jgi:folate-binding protein YgfZ
MPFDAQYQALISQAGVSAMPNRTQVELTGHDRSTFLHGFCTNDIKQLLPGQGCEAFLTNVQGKTVGYVNIHSLPESLVLETVAGMGPSIIESLDRYLIREDVQLHDRSEEWSEILLSGAAAAEVLDSIGGAPGPMENRLVDVDGEMVSVRHIPFADDRCFFLSCLAARHAHLFDALVDQGATVCETEAVEVRRIEMGTPLFGLDVTSDNLPQEVDRNPQAISLTKGCYLGQETVARIDARGHVNRLLVGLRFDTAAIPSPGMVLKVDDKPTARVTSACFSPALEAPLALAYVRRGKHSVGTRIEADEATVTVVDLPVS